MSNIGEIIKTMRLSRGMSQAELAAMVGLRRSAIGNYENGIREPDLDILEALADAFNVSLADLMQSPSAPVRTDPQESELINIYRNLNSTGQAALIGTARGLSANPDMKRGGASNTEMA